MTWTLCTGVRLRVDGQTFLFLSDSTSEDCAEEYAVFQEDGMQIESITFSWCTWVQAENHIRELLSGQTVNMGHYRLMLKSTRVPRLRPVQTSHSKSFGGPLLCC